MQQVRAPVGKRSALHSRQQYTQRDEMELVALGVGRESIHHSVIEFLDQLRPVRRVRQAGRDDWLRERADESGVTLGPDARIPTAGELLVEGDSALAGLRFVDAEFRGFSVLFGRR